MAQCSTAPTIEEEGEGDGYLLRVRVEVHMLDHLLAVGKHVHHAFCLPWTHGRRTWLWKHAG